MEEKPINEPTLIADPRAVAEIVGYDVVKTVVYEFPVNMMKEKRIRYRHDPAISIPYAAVACRCGVNRTLLPSS